MSNVQKGLLWKKEPVKKIHELLQIANIDNMDDVRNPFKKIVTRF